MGNSQPSKRPTLVRETPLSSLWHKKDDRFWVPRALVMMDLRRYARFFIWLDLLCSSNTAQLHTSLLEHQL